MRSVILSALSAVAVCLALATSVRADTVPAGTQIFVNIGGTTANGSPTGNINTATTFTFGQVVSTIDNTGAFSGMPVQLFPPIMLTPSSPTGLMFGNSVFGTFSSTSITASSTGPGNVTFKIVGTWTAGSFSGVTGTFPALLTLGLTQTPAGTGSISFSGSFATPVLGTIIPEPPSFVLGLTGLAAGVVVFGLRRHRRSAITIA